MSEHRPVTCHVFVEEQDLFGSPGSNVRVRVLSDDGQHAEVLVDGCGVHARQGQRHVVPVSALNGGAAMSALAADMVWLIACADAREITSAGYPYPCYWLSSVEVGTSDAYRLNRLLTEGYLELARGSALVLPTQKGRAEL